MKNTDTLSLAAQATVKAAYVTPTLSLIGEFSTTTLHSGRKSRHHHHHSGGGIGPVVNVPDPFS